MCRYLNKRVYKKCKEANPKMFELMEQACFHDYCANEKSREDLTKAECRGEVSLVTLCHHYGYGGIRWRSRKCSK